MSSRTLQDRLAQIRQEIVKQIPKQYRGTHLCARFSGAMDKLIQRHMENLLKERNVDTKFLERMALIAVGGYGRQMLCLYSDLDLHFVFESPPTSSEEEIIKILVRSLFDASIDLAHSVHTIDSLDGFIAQDFNTTTTLMENRFLIGKEEIRETVVKHLNQKLQTPGARRWYMENHLQDWKRRRARQGGKIYVLEPNIKEACGALRDIHALQWLGYIAFCSTQMKDLARENLLKPKEFEALIRALDFLLRARNALHAVDRRKSDVLTIERQVKISQMLGYTQTPIALAEEHLLRNYYDHAREVDRITTSAIESLSEKILQDFRPKASEEKKISLQGPFFRQGAFLGVDSKDADLFQQDPDLIFRVFSLALGLQLRVHPQTRQWIMESAPYISEFFRASPTNRDIFLGILRSVEGVGKTLEDMHECGVLEAYIPEFKKLRHLPRLDSFHQYTVDVHLLTSVQVAEELRKKGRSVFGTPWVSSSRSPVSPDSLTRHAQQVASEIQRWDLLNFSLLLHDIGKGEGRGHVIRGGRIITRIGHRMGMQKPECEVCNHLVLNHQKMNRVAMQRDVEDQKVAEDLAREIGNRETLRMLYVLTICDLAAVGGNAWNDWKAQLLAELFERTLEALYAKRKVRPVGHSSEDRNNPQQVLEALETTLGHQADPKSVWRFLSEMPERYRSSSHSPLDVARHYLLSLQVTEEEPVQWRLNALPERDYSELTIAVCDAPGVFSNVCGALASRGINVLGAQIYSGGENCIDVFQVQDQRAKPLEESPWIERLRQKLNQVILGKIAPKWEAEAANSHPRKPGSWPTRLRDDEYEALHKVEINNDIADLYSVIEIRSLDFPGLLYAITKVLEEEKIDIDLALIDTEASQVRNFFYVTDWENNKLLEDANTARLRERLLDTLTSQKDG